MRSGSKVRMEMREMRSETLFELTTNRSEEMEFIYVEKWCNETNNDVVRKEEQHDLRHKLHVHSNAVNIRFRFKRVSSSVPPALWCGATYY